MRRHPSMHELSAFISGQTSGEAQHRVLHHLETCSTCLDTIDSLWSETLNAFDDSPTPAMDSDRRRRVQRRILHHIRNLETTRGIVQFMLVGPLVFLRGLLAPWRPRT